MSKTYPRWIDDYAYSVHKSYIGMVPASWGPVDFMALYKYEGDTFIAKLAQAVRQLKEKGITPAQAKTSFQSRSILRFAVSYLALEYQHSEPKNKEQFREVVEYLVAVLQALFPEDAFAAEKNVTHSPEEIQNILSNTDWQTGNPTIARELGKLHSSLQAYSYAVYRDFYPMTLLDVYGPYDASPQFGANTILLLKHYVKLRPVELWPQAKGIRHEEIKIWPIYKNVTFRCEFVGMHSIYQGDLLQGLQAYTVMVDGKPVTDVATISDLRNYYAEKALEFTQLYDGMSKRELHKKALEWECYQFVDFFKLAGMDWRPTPEMIASVHGKPIGDRVRMDSFPSYEEFVSSPEYEIYWLKQLYE